MMRYIHYLLLMLAVVSGCGFQMRGSQSITTANIPTLNLRSIAAVTLEKEVRSQLEMAGVAISPTADYSLSLVNETYERTVLSVSPNTGKAEEYLLTLNATMSLSKKDSGELLANELVTVSRDYLFDEDALLGKSSEEEVIRNNLRRQAAAEIIQRMNAVTGKN